ncbi:MFS transporter [Nonomuraea fuscirosea]|jgi:metabolite-proton symporter|uniref:Putative proline/betaine transporter n=1 Tax=Nonomuraea fuscirosea TaxID=1291556 RepID=A0A2T0N0W0_9ACTN|nr:MFS transporter [Nonomuraea fuscirosea]PRX65447.1 metabolite-proton symporter [Nonomuraea fuscirosea]WSA52890.1 MHS family MFS transporter [Nonomuraea fuscirosea]
MATSIKKIVAASLIGTTIEWYDFFLYGSAAALVFNKLFFPESDPLTGTLLAFLTYAVGFVARPLGGLVFGHFGDRIGRKTLLVVSLLTMGAATFLIGCLPTYETLGPSAALVLTALRLVQGFALGGEWGGAVLIVSEHGDTARRGFWASWPQAGAPGGNLLATGVLAALAAWQSEEAFLAWGWRVPFLLSGVLVLIGLWIRLTITESPVFQQAPPEERAPIVGVLKHHAKDVVIAIGARLAENISFYLLTVFVITYAKQTDVDNSTVLTAVLISSAIHFVTIPMWGALSDRFGRRPIYLSGAAGIGVWIFAFFPLVDTGNFLAITLAVTVGLLFHGMMYGPQAAFFSELFGTRTRYTGVSIGAQLSAIVAGALAPIIAVALLQAYGSSVPISVYLGLAALLTLAAVYAARETRGSDLAERINAR